MRKKATDHRPQCKKRPEQKRRYSQAHRARKITVVQRRLVAHAPDRVPSLEVWTEENLALDLVAVSEKRALLYATNSKIPGDLPTRAARDVAAIDVLVHAWNQVCDCVKDPA